MRTAAAVGKQTVRVAVVLGARDESRPSGELCVEKGEGGGGDLPDRLPPWKPGVVLLVEPGGQAALPDAVPVRGRAQGGVGRQLSASGGADALERFNMHGGDPLTNGASAAAALRREAALGAWTDYPDLFGSDVQRTGADVSDVADAELGHENLASEERVGAMHGTYGARPAAGWELSLSCEQTAEALRRAAVESMALEQVHDARQREAHGLAGAVLGPGPGGFGNASAGQRPGVSAADVSTGAVFGSTARNLRARLTEGRSVIPPSSGLRAVRGLLAGAPVAREQAMRLLSQQVWPPVVSAPARGRLLQQLLRLLPLSLQWVDASQGRLTLRMGEAGPEAGPLGPAGEAEGRVRAMDSLQRRLAGPGLLALACTQYNDGSREFGYMPGAAGASSVLTTLLASMPGREPRGIAVRAGAAMQRLRLASHAAASPAAVPRLRVVGALRHTSWRAADVAGSGPVLLGLPSVDEASMALACSGDIPGPMRAGIEAGLRSLRLIEGLGDGQPWQKVWWQAMREWSCELAASVAAQTRPAAAAARGGTQPSRAADGVAASMGMRPGSGLHPDDEDFEGPGRQPLAADMARYLLLAEAAGSRPGTNRTEEEGADLEQAAARAVLFAQQLRDSIRPRAQPAVKVRQASEKT